MEQNKQDDEHLFFLAIILIGAILFALWYFREDIVPVLVAVKYAQLWVMSWFTPSWSTIDKVTLFLESKEWAQLQYDQYFAVGFVTERYLALGYAGALLYLAHKLKKKSYKTIYAHPNVMGKPTQRPPMQSLLEQNAPFFHAVAPLAGRNLLKEGAWGGGRPLTHFEFAQKYNLIEYADEEKREQERKEGNADIYLELKESRKRRNQMQAMVGDAFIEKFRQEYRLNLDAAVKTFSRQVYGMNDNQDKLPWQAPKDETNYMEWPNHYRALLVVFCARAIFVGEKGKKIADHFTKQFNQSFYHKYDGKREGFCIYEDLDMSGVDDALIKILTPFVEDDSGNIVVNKETKMPEWETASLSIAGQDIKLYEQKDKETINRLRDFFKYSFGERKHRFATVRMVCAMKSARALNGTLITPDFIWLKELDRTLYYALNNLGRIMPLIEGAGIYAQMNADNIFEQATPDEEPEVLNAVCAYIKELKKEGWIGDRNNEEFQKSYANHPCLDKKVAN